MAIDVNIRQPSAGQSRVLRFSKSPVRIGRNELNDIPLQDPFVSEWHGIIRFDERQVAYFDLGSTNGTILDGKRLVKSVAAPLSEASRLQLGLLEMTVVRRPDEGKPAETTGKQETGPFKTLSWGVATPSPNSNPNLPVAARDSGAVIAPKLRGLADSNPQLASGAVASSGSSPGDTSGAHETGSPASGATAASAARQAKLIETFCEAFVGLRKGYEQFGAEVGVRTLSGSSPLHRARTGRELLEYLMLPNVDPTATAKELVGIFADFGIHHVALMEGITEGVRAVLQSVDPRANDLDAGGRLFTAAKTKSQWKSFLERFDQLVADDDELHAAIFGDTFARAYAGVTVGDGRGGRTGEGS
jgi:type VI secretion system protein ImpI